MTKNALVLGGLALVLALPSVAIVKKEQVLSSGTMILLPLAPVDPRSLMAGDYMRLEYAITDSLGGKASWPRDGQLVVRVDSAHVAHLVRRQVGDAPLAAGEHLLQYRYRNGRYRVGSDAFHFQEGLADRYQRARYGELRVDDAGGSVLVGLRDSARVALRESDARP